MFDGNPNTLWHSSQAEETTTKGVTIVWKTPKVMTEVVLTRRNNLNQDDYKDVCLVFDADPNISYTETPTKTVCTTGENGQPYLEGNDIVFKFPKRSAGKVS